MNDILAGLIASVLLLLWSLTWFWARDWDFVGKHPANGFFGAIMVVSGLGVIGFGAVVFGEGIIALS